MRASAVNNMAQVGGRGNLGSVARCGVNGPVLTVVRAVKLIKQLFYGCRQVDVVYVLVYDHRILPAESGWLLVGPGGARAARASTWALLGHLFAVRRGGSLRSVCELLWLVLSVRNCG